MPMRRALFSISCFLLAAACTSGAGERPAPAPSGTSVAEPGSTPPGAAGAPGAPAGKPGEAAACASDADCVPAECCHPSSCVAAAQKPDCRAVLCSMECRSGTFDCGGGGCVCRGGRCQAELREQT